MKTTDQRIVWKDKNVLELLVLINGFIDAHEINTVRDYQRKIAEYPGEAPSLWYINQRFGSWDKMLLSLGKKPYEGYKWDSYSDRDLKKIVKDFIKTNGIRSQRSYDQKSVGENIPSLSTLKKRFGDIKFFFITNEKESLSSFELLSLLKTEIERLNLENTLSRTEFEKKYNRSFMPSPSTIIRKTGKTWEELMEEIGFNYRRIKNERLSKNLKQYRK
ncbi:hypothetical protein [Kaistella sp.]|uniref:hypothetical protein n=1 Tax=Kaistella sp. TaxID=2782235 RepID=UPI00359FAC06